MEYKTPVLPVFGEQSFVADNVVFVLENGRPENLAPVQRVHVGLNRNLEQNTIFSIDNTIS